MRTQLLRAVRRRAVCLLAGGALVLGLVPAAEAAAPPTPGRVALGWGYNNSGQLGNGHTARVPAPSSITFPTSFASVVVGRDHTTAIDRRGRVWAWGRNDRGQLGNGTTTSRPRPVRVELPTRARVVQVAVAEDHALALTSTGRVYAWGGNRYGQLGDGSRRDRRVPIRVALGRVSAVGAGRQTSYAALSGGGLRAWGHNQHGQLGDGTRRDRHRPVRVSLSGRTKIAAVDAGDATAVALTSTGRVLAWGDNRSGMVGVSGGFDRRRPVQVRLPGGSRARAVSAGARFAAALSTQGRVVTWGGTTGAELGRGGGAAAGPGYVTVGRPVRQVSAGGSHVLALTDQGQVWAWGENDAQQLGAGSGEVATPGQVTLPAGQRITAVSAGASTSYAMTRSEATSARLRVSPARITVRPGQQVSYAVTREDGAGRTTVPDARLEITHGTCRASTCRASKPGAHTVTVRHRGLRATAVITVAPVAGPSAPPSPGAGSAASHPGTGTPPHREPAAAAGAAPGQGRPLDQDLPPQPAAAAPYRVLAALASLSVPFLRLLDHHDNLRGPHR